MANVALTPEPDMRTSREKYRQRAAAGPCGWPALADIYPA